MYTGRRGRAPRSSIGAHSIPGLMSISADYNASGDIPGGMSQTGTGGSGGRRRDEAGRGNRGHRGERGQNRGSRQGGRGRGRGGHGEHSRKLEHFSFSNLRSMADKDPDELVLDLTSDKCFPATENLVSGLAMDDGKVVVVLKVFANACGCSTASTWLIKLLNTLPKSNFLSIHLSSYIIRLPNEQIDPVEREDQLKLMIKLFAELLRKLPSSFADLPIPQLYMTAMSLNARGDLDQGILSKVEALMRLKEEMAEKIKMEGEEASRRPKRRNPRNEAALYDEEAPPDDFRNLSVVPTHEDVRAGGRPFLRRNKVDGKYNSPEHYLDVQFRLLREDFVRPLREGIDKLLTTMGSHKLGSLQDIRVYHDVRILYPVFTSKGLTYKISFDVKRLSRVRWENSKRLIYGSLLCLSKDKFETFVLATVENRDLKELAQGLVEVRFTDTHKVNLEKCTYQMVETTAYFEAYRHVLEGLKQIEPERIPFKRYIVDCEPETDPPAYLRNRFRERITYDLTPIMTDKISDPFAAMHRLSLNRRRGEAVEILSDSSWPSAKQLELDDSQYKAVKHALTSEFALIQGPPGTGKTYIGLKVVKVLLHNKDQWLRGTELMQDSSDEEDNPLGTALLRRRQQNKKPARHPILVVCYTNHALDQFLEGIHEFHPEGIVRIGGRSQSEILKDCSLKEIKYQMRKKKEVPRNIRSSFFDVQSDLDRITSKIKAATENLKKCMESLVHERELHHGSFMSTVHYNQITTNPRTGERTNETMMCHWLGLTADSPFESSLAVPPIALFPLNRATKGMNVLNPHHVAKINKARLAPGPDGSENGSYELQGARDSFITISNMENGFLDTYQSMTILLFVYPMSPRGGPIVCFQNKGIIGIQISQDGIENGKGVLTAGFNRRDGVALKPLRKAVLTMNQWNYVVASYEFDTGIYSLWHDGKLVQQLQNIHGWMELGTQFPVYLGSLNLRNHTAYFEGRVCGLHFFPEAIGRQQIMRIAGIQEEDLVPQKDDSNEGNNEVEEEEEEEKENDILYEATAEQDLRLLDVDEVTRFGENARLRPLMTVNPFERETSGFQGAAQFQFQNPKKRQRKINDRIKKELSHGDMMSSREASMVTNIWELSAKDKWRLYRYWVEELCKDYRGTIEKHHDEFENGAKKLNEVKSMEDQSILKNATVIGMTTTGASKYRHLIQIIRPRITIVEEAAEVLESHIVTSLSPGCQHLILIGDHQQLRPNPTVFELARNYQLDTSLFERMIKIGMRFERLNAQHRMRPEISSMMKHIYDDLQDHESVLNFETIKGVDQNIFFIDHRQQEDFVEEGRSRFNLHEARYLAALCKYFIQQGYKRQQITILTMYTGQLIQMKKQMPKSFFQGVRVCAVDNFQGEENDIILLSLVRSNEEGNIGFLRISNRVCVALSRAKKGFYCIGNLELMCEKEELWRNIIGDMKKEGKVGPHLTLTCQKHPKNIIKASTAADFSQAPEGGCMEPCNTRLECGHVCQSVCHPGDPDHQEYKCKEKCTKMMSCEDHKCKKLCYQECGDCFEPVPKEIPSCQHMQQVPCSMDPSKYPCQAPCVKKLPCGKHSCKKRCFEKCDAVCKEKVDKFLKCGHKNKVECQEDIDTVPCRAPCGELLKCEHPCKGTCSGCFKGRLHQPCKADCGRELFCGHSCKEACTKNCPPCQAKCTNKCVHSECPKKCGEPCTPCAMPCAWTCEHYRCTKLCGEPCNRQRCNKPCKKTLRCGHDCIGMCGEPCPKKCRICHKDEVTEIFFGEEEEPDARFVELTCGHVIEVNAMDLWMDDASGDNSSIQLKRCPKCKTPIRTTLRYGNSIKTVLGDFEKVKAKLVVPDYKLQLETLRLKGKLVASDFHDTMKDDIDKIRNALDIKGLTTEQLDMYENQINFLSLLSKIMKSGKKQIEHLPRTRSFSALLRQRTSLEKLEITLLAPALALKKRIMVLRSRFSDQEKEEIHDELLRFSLIWSFRLLCNALEQKDIYVDLSHIASVIESDQRISKDDIDRHMKTIKDVGQSRGLDICYQEVTDDEKNMIVKAMGMSQGHWFKCPKGHIYCIGDCGGAMEESKCPECGSKIGGQSHTLRSDNTLAGEMDGARHAAWSNFTNNMRNFDLDNVF